MSESEIRKKNLSLMDRFRRLVGSTLDPRAWAHGLKVMNYYNYTHVAELRKISLGPDVRISPTVSFANGQNIEIHARTRIGAGCSIWAGNDTSKIVIGEDCLFAPNSMLVASNYRFNDGAPVTEQAMKEADIILGKDVWLGYGCIVLAGAKIGDGAIIGAGVTVRGEVPPNAILGAPQSAVIGQRKLPSGSVSG